MTDEDVLSRIIEFVDIPTSANDLVGQHRGAAWLQARLTGAGFSASLRQGPRSPFVVGRLDRADTPKLAIYVMYDTRRPKSTRRIPSHIESLGPLGRCLIGALPIANKAAIELFVTAVERVRDDPRCPSLVLVGEGSEIDGSLGLGELLLSEKAFYMGPTSVFWPRASQSSTGQARLNLAYRGMVGLRLTVSRRSPNQGQRVAAMHSQYRPWVGAPTWRLIAAVNSLVTDDGNRLAFSLPESKWSLPPPPPTFDAHSLLDTLQIDPGMIAPDADDLWAQLAFPSVNVELVGTPGPGVGLIQPSAAARLQFRLPPGYSTSRVVDAVRSHLVANGWADIAIDVEYAIDGASTDVAAPVMSAMRSMYSQQDAATEVWPIAMSTAPTCAFAHLGYDVADGGLGHQDDRRNALVLDDAGSIAGLDRTIAGYSTLLTSFTTAMSPRGRM